NRSSCNPRLCFEGWAEDNSTLGADMEWLLSLGRRAYHALTHALFGEGSPQRIFCESLEGRRLLSSAQLTLGGLGTQEVGGVAFNVQHDSRVSEVSTIQLVGYLHWS